MTGNPSTHVHVAHSVSLWLNLTWNHLQQLLIAPQSPFSLQIAALHWKAKVLDSWTDLFPGLWVPVQNFIRRAIALNYTGICTPVKMSHCCRMTNAPADPWIAIAHIVDVYECIKGGYGQIVIVWRVFQVCNSLTDISGCEDRTEIVLAHNLFCDNP